MAETRQLKITARYDKDTFRCHRYIIEEAEGIKGTVYIDKDEDVPKEIVVSMQVKGNNGR